MKTKILAAMFGAMLMISAIGGTAFAGHNNNGNGNSQGRGHVEVCDNENANNQGNANADNSRFADC